MGKAGLGQRPVAARQRRLVGELSPDDVVRQTVPPHCELIGLWECKDEADEKALHEQFNEGELKRADCHNEFYDEMEWPKIYRELCTWFTPLPLPAEDYPRWRAKGRGRNAAAGVATGASTAGRRLTSHGTGCAP